MLVLLVASFLRILDYAGNAMHELTKTLLKSFFFLPSHKITVYPPKTSQDRRHLMVFDLDLHPPKVNQFEMSFYTTTATVVYQTLYKLVCAKSRYLANKIPQ